MLINAFSFHLDDLNNISLLNRDFPMSRDNERNYRRSGSDRRSGRDRRSEYCGQSDEEKFLGKSRFTRDSKRDIGVLMASVVTDRKIRKKKD